MFTKEELQDIRESYYSYLEGSVLPQYMNENLLELDNKYFPEEEQWVNISKTIVKKCDEELNKKEIK